MKVLDYFFASRPLLQLPIWTVYLVSLHSHLRLSGGTFGCDDLFMMVGLSVIFAGAAYLNQVYDYESDALNGKVGFLQRGYLAREGLLAASIPTLSLPMFAAPFFGLITLFIFASLALLAYVYSAPPLRLKDHPLGGLLSNMTAHGFLVAVAVMPEMSMHNAGLVDWNGAFYFFLTVGGTYLLTTLPDREGDAAVGKRTVSVTLGRAGALITALFLFALAAWSSFRSGDMVLGGMALGAVVLTLAALTIRSEKAVLLAAKLPLLALTILACWYFPAYCPFVVALLIATRIYYRRRFGLTYPVLA